MPYVALVVIEELGKYPENTGEILKLLKYLKFCSGCKGSHFAGR